MGMKSPSCLPSAAAEPSAPSRALLTEQPLSTDEALVAVRAPDRGGIVTFLGDVRGTEEGRPIAAIVYEAYGDMALDAMERIAAEASERWSASIAVRHRTGRVPVGETAFLVAVAAEHRPEAFSACRYVVDQVKLRAPLWKISFEESPPCP